MKINLDHFG